MSRIVIASSVFALLVACGGSSVAVGKTGQTDQGLQKKKDGSATGNGTTCSWADTVLFDEVKLSAPSAPVPTYKLGEEFTSIDGCNSCSCSAQGIMCTLKACDPPVACDASARICPDGTTVGATGPKCEFVCPGDTVCTDDAKKCPDGSFVGRSGPNCEFVCPNDPPVACPAVIRVCADGSYAKQGPNCAQTCPTEVSCQEIELKAGNQLRAVAAQYLKCELDTDCTFVGISSSCVDQCAVPVNKAGVVAVQGEASEQEARLCQAYSGQNCTLVHPACAPSPPPRCVNKVCQ